jgi:hypothetical protein
MVEAWSFTFGLLSSRGWDALNARPGRDGVSGAAPWTCRQIAATR